MTPKRHGFPWSVNECLQLEREFDLLRLSINEIAKIHQRNVDAIIFKLKVEGLIYNPITFKSFIVPTNISINALPI